MQALILTEYGRLSYLETADPVFGDNEVLIEVMACGICGSDVHGMDGSTGRRIPPLIMGHEASGVIKSVGRNIKDWKKGDRVSFDSTVYPLHDWFTLSGHYNLSDNREVLGVSPGSYKRHGAFAEYITVPSHILYRIPDNVTFVQAALAEPVAVALHALSLSGLCPGESCLVTGTGMIGCCVIQAAAAAGAVPLLAADIIDSRLNMALMLGATAGINTQRSTAAESVKNETGGRGVDVVFDATGISETVNFSIESVRKGGRVILVGNLAEKIAFPLQSVVTREIKLQGSCAVRGEYETALRLISYGKIRVDPLISAIAPLSEGEQWFRKLYNKETGLSKVVLVPDRIFETMSCQESERK
jgi:L-iditol 2-dehydrogenase